MLHHSFIYFQRRLSLQIAYRAPEITLTVIIDGLTPLAIQATTAHHHLTATLTFVTMT